MNYDNWYYVEKGKRIGPISFDEIKSLVIDKKIYGDTLVWYGDGGWKPLRDIKILNEIINTPPSIPKSAVNNKYVWLIIALSIIWILIPYNLAPQLSWLFLILTIIIGTLDRHALISAGYSASSVMSHL